MTRKSHIVPVETADSAPMSYTPAADDQPSAEHETEDQFWHEDTDDDASLPIMARNNRVKTALAFLLTIGWSGFFIWAHRVEIFSGIAPARAIELISAWIPPMLLIAIIWLLMMRNSTKEAQRFGTTARTLSEESQLLEQRLLNVNRELSLAREFITAQGRDLESVGRMASQRLTEHAQELRTLILENDGQVQTIASTSTTAMENMDRLRSDLPIIANAARDVSNQIGAAGMAAEGQLASLVEGFQQLEEAGLASERQVLTVQEKASHVFGDIATHIQELQASSNAQLDALAQNIQTIQIALGQQEVDAMAAIRRRADDLQAELNQAHQLQEQQATDTLHSLQARIDKLQDQCDAWALFMQEEQAKAENSWIETAAQLREHIGQTLAAAGPMIGSAAQQMASHVDAIRQQIDALGTDAEARRQIMAQSEMDTLATFESSLSELDGQIEARKDMQLRLSRDFADHGDALKRRLEMLHSQIDEIADKGTHIQDNLAQGLAQMAHNITAGRQQLEGMDTTTQQLTDASVRLLEVIHGSVTYSEKELPAALGAAQAQLAGLQQESEAACMMLNEAAQRSEDLAAYVMAAREQQAGTMGLMDDFHARLIHDTQTQSDTIAALRDRLDQLARDHEACVTTLDKNLASSMAQASQATQETLASIEQESTELAARLARKIGISSAAIVEGSALHHIHTALDDLNTASGKAMTLSHEAASQLRDQLARVDELAGHLEARVSHTRERAEEQADQDFARRVALITEALNSHAIDIAKVLSSEVADTAWAAYLKGDRGIFTRRAIRLLDHGSAKAILEHYEQDDSFREHVNRYVHDFEAMLRTILSTRDGHALGVTLLSSDMGKLYVALAQAIERLRS